MPVTDALVAIVKDFKHEAHALEKKEVGTEEIAKLLVKKDLIVLDKATMAGWTKRCQQILDDERKVGEPSKPEPSGIHFLILLAFSVIDVIGCCDFVLSVGKRSKELGARPGSGGRNAPG